MCSETRVITEASRNEIVRIIDRSMLQIGYAYFAPFNFFNNRLIHEFVR